MKRPMPTARAAFVTAQLLLLTALGPQCARADDATRISQLESDIRQLRIQLDDQRRRIEWLENQLQVLALQPRVGPPPGIRADRPAAAASGPLPWHSPEVWDRITNGMTEAEVTAILGEPTSVETAGSRKTLFYRGAVKDSGTLSGHVNFRDNRVVATNRPAFAGS